MVKAYDVMTRALATCEPDASVSYVAAMMRDRNIGDVLVVEDGKLRGIVTDRDLALQTLTGDDDPRQMSISKYMSTRIVTGEAGWNLDEVSRMMSRHQVRRLPIVEKGRLVGIISLGDLALQDDQKDAVRKSLQAISAPSGISFSGHSGFGRSLLGFSLAILATSMAAWLAWSHSGQVAFKQFTHSDLFHSGEKVVHAALEKVDEAASSKPVRELGKQLRTNLDDFSSQLPTLAYKAPKSKHAWFN